MSQTKAAINNKEDCLNSPELCFIIFAVDNDQLADDARSGGAGRGQQPPAPPRWRDSQGPALCQETAAGENKQSVQRKNIDLNQGSKDKRELILIIVMLISFKIFCNVGPTVIMWECGEHLPL